MREALAPYGLPVALPPFSALPEPVCGHPDLLTFYDGGTLFTFARYYEENKALFDALPCAVRPLDLPVGDYPADLWFDCLPLGKRLLCKEGCAPRELTKRFGVLPVKQGYARCSTLKLSDDAVITADAGIARAAEECGARVLRVPPMDIALPGYGEGFIGGASAVIGGRVLFFGALPSPDAEAIAAFICGEGLEAAELPIGKLTDRGGLTVVE